MAQVPDGPAALPLSVRCSPDGRFVEAMRALVGRVGATAGEGAQTEAFVAALQQVIAWLLTHVPAQSGPIAFDFTRDGNALTADVRWSLAGARPPSVSDLPALAPADGEMTCGVEDDQVVCRVSCRCA